MKVTHSFDPIYNKDTKILILGSFPSVKSRELDFYYMNKYNRFWTILGKLYNKNFIDMDNKEKTKTLNELHIGLYDVIYSCTIEGSKDSSIKDVVPGDIRKIVEESKVNKIYLNGNKAYQLFIKYFKDYKDKAFPLPSTSPANAKSSIDDLLEKWKVILENE